MALSDPHQIGSTNGDLFPSPRPESSEPEDEPYITKPRYLLAGGLLLATVFTTLMAGIQLQNDFNTDKPMFTFSQGILPLGWIAQQPSRLLLGIPFSVTLLLILFSHEMGHFVACKRYDVQATLPYFIPFPSYIGTLGAFIRIRSPFPSRAALFDIGIAGPIAGFLVAIPALVAGLTLSKVEPDVVSKAEMQLGHPAIFHLIRLGGNIHSPLGEIYLHPIAVAAWVGMLATSLNLLPGSQLDGGHILYSVWPGAHRNFTRILALALLPMGLFLWTGWLVWVAALLFFGTIHPEVPNQPGLNMGRKWLALFALLMLMLSFMMVPIRSQESDKLLLDWHKVTHNVQRWMR